MKELVIFGAGVRASLVYDLVTWQFRDKYSICGYFDDNKPAGTPGPGELPVLGNIAQGLEYLAAEGREAFIAYGTFGTAAALALYATMKERGLAVASLVAPDAIVSPSATIGENVMVTPGSYIGSYASLGNCICIHGGVTIEHHCRIGSGILFGPGSTLSGFAQVGDGSFIGIGSTILPEVKVGRGTMVGGGSVVIKDLPDGVVAYGNPARPVRDVNEKDEVASLETITNFSLV